MDRVRKQRAPVRTQVTMTANELTAELGKEIPEKKVLLTKKQKLEEKMDSLVDYDQKMLEALLDEEATDEQVNAETEQCEIYRDNVRLVLYDVEQKLKKLSVHDSPPGSTRGSCSSANGHHHQQRNFKLPKIKPIKFNGEYEEYLGWWAQFSKIHEDETLHVADKFHYLIEAMIAGTRAHTLVKSYPPTAENYPKVIAALQDRFGDKTLLAEVYIRKLQSIVLGLDKNKSKFDLCKIYDEIETQLRCLESLEVTLDHSAFMLPLIESTLPIDLLKVWQRSPDAGYRHEDKKSTEERLKSLLSFLRSEVKGEERIKMIHGDSAKEEKVQTTCKQKRDRDVPTAQSLYSGSSRSCLFCDKANHDSQDCRKANHMTMEQRQQKVKDSNSCFRCLKKGHRSKDCTSSVVCTNCGRNKHYAVLCRASGSSQNKVDSNTNNEQGSSQPSEGVKTANATACYSKGDGMVLMKTVQVDILGNNGQKYRVRLLFDEGSNRSYVKSATAERLKCPVLEEFNLQTTLFGGQTTTNKRKRKYSVKLHSIHGKYSKDLSLINEDMICGSCPTIPRGPWLRELSRKKIYVNDTGTCAPEIEILIGSDLWPHLMTGRMCKLNNGLIAVESVFGWTLSGEIPIITQKSESMCSTVIALLTQGEKSLPDLWNLETIGIKDPVEKLTQDEHNQIVKLDFQKKITRDMEGRYQVQLPWIDREIPLPNNKHFCERSLLTLTNKLKKEELFKTYDKIFRDWEQEGIIEVSHEMTNREHYLPHHRVLKLDSKTTPVRPVFNASFKIGNHPSLNDCLEVGPNLLELIPSLLLRFRQKDVAAISDIRKAFQMIKVDEDDKNFQKFLWWEGNEDQDGETRQKIKIYRHARVVFGMNCSPFVLAAVLEHHFDQIKDERKAVVDQLQESLYVDNSLKSFDSSEEYHQFRKISIEVMKEANMDLRQWESNVEESLEPITNVLGLLWDKREDGILCKVPTKPCEEMKINKRTVLSIISQVYDPIGFTSPAVLQAKLLLQSSWAMTLPWDEEWNPLEKKKFNSWMNEIGELGRIRIPRIAIGSTYKNLQYHLFTDASQDAYAAVVYSRVEYDNCVKVQLLLSKSRLAPLPKKKKSKSKEDSDELQRVTIPRLELLGCFIGARLLQTVKESLKIENVPIVCWSDSSTALAWIKKDEDWGTFVGNRVREINRLTLKEEWRHVPGHLNPADLPSRGCSPYELRQSTWWEGPTWLYDDEANWPSSQSIQIDEDLVFQERRKTAFVNVTQEIQIKEPRFGSYWKNLRTAAYVRRFINNCRVKENDRVKTNQLSLDEIRCGENDVLREIQQQHFPNNKVNDNVSAHVEDDGLMHVKTKLTYKEDTALFKSPILLPNKDPMVNQLIEFTHRIYCHAGAQFFLAKLRERYWIIQGRRTVNKVIKRCVTCRRFSAKNIQVNPAPLPIHRTETNCAFETTGVDLAGPFYLKGGRKSWIVIYTCAVYRGVYFDIVDSLSAEEFVDSLHKFTCVIGRPSTMFSDNGTNFVGAQTVMKKLNWKAVEEKFGVKQIMWRFNPPTAAWWGGFWERLIRSLKDLLRRMIATAKLTRKELSTCMAEIAFVMNNRPLTTLTESPEDLIPLTPAMFMRDLPLAGLPEVEMMKSGDFQEAFHRLNKIKDSLKARFRKEYLGNLIKTSPEPKVGDVVLIGYDNKKRFEWPMGRIIELFPGKDKKTRVAKVKTSRGILLRPIQRLYPLEVPHDDLTVTVPIQEDAIQTHVQEQNAVEPDKTEEQRTRFGRKVTQPKRYGQWFQ